MAANLTPQYKKAEDAYRQATSPEEELRCLELMFRELPKHKGTDKLQADLKHKLSLAKKEVETARATKKAAAGGAPKIPRQGAGRAVLLGGPNAGKSQFIRAVTRATPEVAPYPFTTRECSPAMMAWEDVMVQLLDTPPTTADYLEPSLLNLVRGADLVVLLVDLGSDDGIDDLLALLGHFKTGKTRLARTSYLDEDDVGLSFTAALVAPNKIDLPEAADRLTLLHEFCPLDLPEYPISAETGTGLTELRKAIYETLDVVRVYSKLPTAKEADFSRPFTVRRGGTLLDVAELVHKEMASKFQFARVWGKHVFDGTPMKGDYVVHDKDIVELHSG